jgi:hypothetical protein
MAERKSHARERASDREETTDPNETPPTQQGEAHGSDLTNIREEDPQPVENESAESLVEQTQEVGIPVEPLEGEVGGQFEGDPNRYPASEEDLPRGW